MNTGNSHDDIVEKAKQISIASDRERKDSDYIVLIGANDKLLLPTDSILPSLVPAQRPSVVQWMDEVVARTEVSDQNSLLSPFLGDKMLIIL